MRKRILQTVVVASVLSVITVVGSVQTAIAQEEIRMAAVRAAEEQEARERAAEAWEELEESCPELHLGCASSVEDVIAMGTLIEIPTPPVEEVVDEQETGQILPQQVGTVYQAGARPLVCVDAGHLGYTVEGYRNTGAVSVLGMVEQDWSLEVARVLRDELVARGYDVYMVRDTGELSEYPYNLGERTTFTNEMKCDICVAIHWDSFAKEEVDGYHTIYKGDKKSPNYRLAKAVSDSYGEALNGAISRYSSPQSRDDLWQLNWAEMPMIIVECGFSSNLSDATWLENEDNYLTIAQGIANGIDAYYAGERKIEQENQTE